jgi:hypothetical protein
MTGYWHQPVHDEVPAERNENELEMGCMEPEL